MSGFIKVSVKMSKSMEDLIKNNEALVTAAMIPILNEHGAKLEKEIKKDLSDGGYGPLRKPKRKCTRDRVRDYTPSKRGEPPKLRTGALRASIGFLVNSRIGKKLTLVIGSLRSGTARDRYLGKTQNFIEGVNYSGKLEDSGELNRPFLEPAIMRNQEDLIRKISAAISKLFRGEK